MRTAAIAQIAYGHAATSAPRSIDVPMSKKSSVSAMNATTDQKFVTISRSATGSAPRPRAPANTSAAEITAKMPETCRSSATKYEPYAAATLMTATCSGSSRIQRIANRARPPKPSPTSKPPAVTRTNWPSATPKSIDDPVPAVAASNALNMTTDVPSLNMLSPSTMEASPWLTRSVLNIAMTATGSVAATIAPKSTASRVENPAPKWSMMYEIAMPSSTPMVASNVMGIQFSRRSGTLMPSPAANSSGGRNTNSTSSGVSDSIWCAGSSTPTRPAITRPTV